MIQNCFLQVDVISFGDVRNTFRHHEDFMKTMIVNVYHNQLWQMSPSIHHHHHHQKQWQQQMSKQESYS